MQIVKLLLFLTFAASTLIASADGYIQQWFKAEEFKKSGDKQAEFEARLLCFELAIKAKDPNYSYAAASSSVFALYVSGRQVEAGKLAHNILEKLQALPEEDSFRSKICRSEVFMILDRGLQAQGRIGDGWRANGAVAAILRGQHPGPDDGGDALSIDEILRLPANLRGMGWRCLGREADYLDISGRSQDALDLLAKANLVISEQWNQLQSTEKFYAYKVLSSYTSQLDFLGYTKDALDLQAELLTKSADGSAPSSYKKLQMNYLRNLSQWEGPSEEVLDKARQIAKELNAMGAISATGVDRLIAKMELDFKASEAALQALAEAIAKNESSEEWFEATYSTRDSMVARSRSGEEIPDSEFHENIGKMRAQGNKRGEPTIYTEFANHLVRTGRISEALPLYREALRLVRCFRRDFHEIPLLCRILEVQLATGTPAAVEAALDELNATIARIKNLPPERIVLAALPRAQANLALNREKEARQIIEQAIAAGQGLPEHKLIPISKEVIDSLFANPITLIDASPETPVIFRIQPELVTTLAIPGDSATARFTLSNPSPFPATKNLIATGPGAHTQDGSISFDPNKPSQQTELAVTLGAGSEETIKIETNSPAENSEFKAELKWDSSDSTSGWIVNWDPNAKNSAILDASQIKGDPFRSISFHHHVQLPVGMAAAAFRIVSPEPIRVEYYDTRSSHLIAIDANGNGDFSEEGDLHLHGADGTAAAWITEQTGSSIELRIFGINSNGVIPFDKPVTLRAEVLRDGTWTLEAENILR
ncbi:MAG: hypothetical protein ACSHX9_14085 [Luteolibacter sp.]